MSDLSKYVKIIESVEDTTLHEGKIEERFLSQIDIKFSSMRGNFESATHKFFAARKFVSTRQSHPMDIKKVKEITPAMFFEYKKGKRYMVKPEPKYTNDLPSPVQPKRSNEDIPFTPDTTGEFKTVDNNAEDKYTFSALIRYYKNTYYNSMSTRELALNINRKHFDYNDDVTISGIIEQINKEPLSDKVKNRLPDDTIVSKSVEHFGFKTEDELRQAMESSYKYVHDDVQQSREMAAMASPMPSFGRKAIDSEMRNRGVHEPMVARKKSEIVDAYLKRDAKELNRLTKEFHIIYYLYRREFTTNV